MPQASTLRAHKIGSPTLTPKEERSSQQPTIIEGEPSPAGEAGLGGGVLASPFSCRARKSRTATEGRPCKRNNAPKTCSVLGRCRGGGWVQRFCVVSERAMPLSRGHAT